MASAIKQHGIEHIIIHTGQHYDYEMSQIFFEDMKIPIPDYNLEVGSSSQGEQLGEIIKYCEKSLLTEKPDAVLVYGDTNSTLGGALAARKNSMYVGHIESGLRSFDFNMQEEINRILTDHISNSLFCPTVTAMNNLRIEGLSNRAYLTGDVIVDVLVNRKKNDCSALLTELAIQKKAYVLVTVHRAENVDDKEKLMVIVDILSEIRKKDIIVFPLHPRTAKALQRYGIMDKLCDANIRLIKPTRYSKFIMLEENARVIITDSGGVQKEACILGVPCITLREETEWVETIENGMNVLVGNNKLKALSALDKSGKIDANTSTIFGEGGAAERILEIIAMNLKNAGRRKIQH